MKYIVIEIQDNGVEVAHLFDSFDNEQAAWSKYYTVLGYAAVSNLKVHTAMICDEFGGVFESRCFRHGEENEE